MKAQKLIEQFREKFGTIATIEGIKVMNPNSWNGDWEYMLLFSYNGCDGGVVAMFYNPEFHGDINVITQPFKKMADAQAMFDQFRCRNY